MSFTTISTSLISSADLAYFQEHGHLIIRQVFSQQEMQALDVECQRLITEHQALIDEANLRCRFMPHYETGEKLFEVFDPVNDISPMFNYLCHDPRLLEILHAIYEEPACLFKEKMIFKPGGAKGYPIHQDIPQCWAGFPQSFLTVLIPIDSLTSVNGATEVYSGYNHKYLSDDPCVYMFEDDAVDAERKVTLIMEPGDIAIFHGLTPHGSTPNKTNSMRRTFYVSYNKLSEGGDQRVQHYQEFQEKIKDRIANQSGRTPYFK